MVGALKPALLQRQKLPAWLVETPRFPRLCCFETAGLPNMSIAAQEGFVADPWWLHDTHQALLQICQCCFQSLSGVRNHHRGFCQDLFLQCSRAICARFRRSYPV
ncbi:hypothetical protein ABBQ38_003871 [Trebouxia sp. C0009 RCD-2024]